MNRLVLIQHVWIRWSKYDRGPGPGARRKALPREFPFEPPGESHLGWSHLVYMNSDEDYFPRHRWDEATRPTQTQVRVRKQGDFAEIRAHIATRQPRRVMEGTICRLPFGQRMILRINERWDYRLQRGYDEHNYIIGYADTATLDLPLFREIDERELLY